MSGRFPLGRPLYVGGKRDTFWSHRVPAPAAQRVNRLFFEGVIPGPVVSVTSYFCQDSERAGTSAVAKVCAVPLEARARVRGPLKPGAAFA